MEHQVKKYYDKAGKVAVLYSPGYGAGWSTWVSSDEGKEFFLFDKGLVELAMRKANKNDVMCYLQKKGIRDYIGGWDQIEIEWMKPGTLFEVTEYDGYEGIEYLVGKPWHRA